MKTKEVVDDLTMKRGSRRVVFTSLAGSKNASLSWNKSMSL